MPLVFEQMTLGDVRRRASQNSAESEQTGIMRKKCSAFLHPVPVTLGPHLSLGDIARTAGAIMPQEPSAKFGVAHGEPVNQLSQVAAQRRLPIQPKVTELPVIAC